MPQQKAIFLLLFFQMAEKKKFKSGKCTLEVTSPAHIRPYPRQKRGASLGRQEKTPGVAPLQCYSSKNKYTKSQKLLLYLYI